MSRSANKGGIRVGMALGILFGLLPGISSATEVRINCQNSECCPTCTTSGAGPSDIQNEINNGLGALSTAEEPLGDVDSVKLCPSAGSNSGCQVFVLRANGWGI